jgi:hypothetical protein
MTILAGATSAGCGSGNSPPAAYPAAAEQLVSQTDLNRFGPVSPEHALMAWWRDAQFSDVSGYLSHFTVDVRAELGQRQAERQLPVFAAGIRTAKPQIVDVELTGHQAIVYTKIVFRQPVGASRYITTTRPQAFRMIRVGPLWELSDASFVDSITHAALSSAPEATSG